MPPEQFADFLISFAIEESAEHLLFQIGQQFVDLSLNCFDFFTQPWSEQPVAEVVEVLPEAEKGLVLLPCDTIPAIKGDVTFEDNELEEVLRSICNAYKVEIVFRNEEQKHILLHFSYNTEDKLQDVVDGLNLLKKFCLKQKDNKLTVE